jgi:lipid A 4'-phosphatase
MVLFPPGLRNARYREALVMLLLFSVLALIFRFFPVLDLEVASSFYTAERGFYSPDNWWLAIPYRGMPILAQTVALILLLGWGGGFFIRRWQKWQRQLGFLLVAAIIGPHLVVGVGLKEHVGRARPANIVEFGGPQVFTPAFVMSNQCQKNCAFVSAHVASAAFLMAFGWLSPPALRRRWLLASVVFSACLGMARIAQGGHFLSDVIFAFFSVYWSLWVTEYLFRLKGWLPERTADIREA